MINKMPADFEAGIYRFFLRIRQSFDQFLLE